MKAYLETERLLLREFTEDDADALFELDSDPDVMRFLGPFRLADPDAYRRHIRTAYFRYYADGKGFGCWAAIDKQGGAFLGWFSLRPAPDHRYAAALRYSPDEIELGYRLRKAAWGKSYATEGSRELVRKAFVELGVAQVVASALVGNSASTRVMEKVGLRRVPGEFPLPGFEQPSVKYALNKDQFQHDM